MVMEAELRTYLDKLVDAISANTDAAIQRSEVRLIARMDTLFERQGQQIDRVAEGLARLDTRMDRLEERNSASNRGWERSRSSWAVSAAGSTVFPTTTGSASGF
jgi:hypothetical protein